MLFGCRVHILLLIILFDFLEPLLFHLLFHLLHLLFLSLLLLIFLFLEQLFLFLFLLLLHQVVPVSGVSLLQKRDKVLDSFYISLFLLLPFLFVLFLHFSFDVSIGSISRVIIVNPTEIFVCCKVLPVIIELEHALLSCLWVPKPFILSCLLLEIFSHGKRFSLLGFDFFENIPVNIVKSTLAVIESFEAGGTEVGPDVKSKTIHFHIFLRHFVLVEQYFLPVVVVPGALVGVGQHLVGFSDLQKFLPALLSGVLIGMVLERKLAIALWL